MKPKVKRIPKHLQWTKRYASIGDLIQYWLLPSRTIGNRPVRSKFGVVAGVTKNRYGRISYRLSDGTVLFTEELTPLQHKGCTK